MNYMGGKHRQGPKIAEVVGKILEPGMDYYEPFCGAMGSAYRVIEMMLTRGIVPKNLNINLSDINVSLITMWEAVLNGWIPPDIVTEETYNTVKSVRDPSDPMTAYCGFGMSFGSKWFGGYARNGRGTNYALNAQRSTLLKAKVLLKAVDYAQISPQGAVVYLDPPYKGRTKAHGVAFNSNNFWDYARKLSLTNNVIVTEFIAPSDWVVIHSWGDTVVRHHSGNSQGDGTSESIFIHESRRDLIEKFIGVDYES